MRKFQLLSSVILLATSCAESNRSRGEPESAPSGTGSANMEDRSRLDSAINEEAALPRWREPAPMPDEYGPYQVRLGNDTFAYIQRVSVAAEASMPLVSPTGGTVLNYSLFVDETQSVEFFSLFVPSSQVGVERPLLTAFHSFGLSHRDIDINTSFFHEAETRGWFLIAPLQRSLADPTGGNVDIHYSSAQSQLHVEAVIDFILDHYEVDRDRIYGVGFSMGGGGAMSFAARHRNRRRGAFAAVVNHTGSVAISDVYANLPLGSTVANLMELIFGGLPAEVPFEWQRSSLIEVDDQGALVPNGQHMATNLAHVPTLTWYNTSDTVGYLVNQSIELVGYMQSLSATSHELVTVDGSNAPGCGSIQHCWGSLDEAQACDWLEQHSLNAFPQSGALLADRSGQWEYFRLVQDQEGEFSRLTYGVDTASDTVRLSFPTNLSSITTSLQRLAVSAVQVKLALEGFGGQSPTLVLRDVQLRPSSVMRDGNALGEDCSGSSGTESAWCYDPTGKTLTLVEREQNAISWCIDF